MFQFQLKSVQSELQTVKQMIKLVTAKSCSEMSAYGINASGTYLLDPDGSLTEFEPISVSSSFSVFYSRPDIMRTLEY